MKLASTLLILISLMAGVNNGTTFVLGDHMVTNPQRLKPSFHAMGPYRIHGKQPAAFEDFCEFTLTAIEKTDESGNLSVKGWVETGKPVDISGSTNLPSGLSRCQGGARYLFDTAVLKRSGGGLDEIEFKTSAIEGIHYTFKGVFFEKPKWVNDMYVDLEGSLSKFKNGGRVSAAQVRLVNWTYE